MMLARLDKWGRSMQIARHHLNPVVWIAVLFGATLVPLAAEGQAPLPVRKRAIAAPLNPIWNIIPKTAEEGKPKSRPALLQR